MIEVKVQKNYSKIFLLANKENLNQYDVIKINMQEFLSMTDTIEEMLEML